MSKIANVLIKVTAVSAIVLTIWVSWKVIPNTGPLDPAEMLLVGSTNDEIIASASAGGYSIFLFEEGIWKARSNLNSLCTDESDVTCDHASTLSISPLGFLGRRGRQTVNEFCNLDECTIVVARKNQILPMRFLTHVHTFVWIIPDRKGAGVTNVLFDQQLFRGNY